MSCRTGCIYAAVESKEAARGKRGGVSLTTPIPYAKTLTPKRKPYMVVMRLSPTGSIPAKADKAREAGRWLLLLLRAFDKHVPLSSRV